MIPLLIGAAAVAAGAAFMSDDKPQQEAVTQNKKNLSDSQVQARLNRAGRHIKTAGGNFTQYDSAPVRDDRQDNSFSADFERIENMLANPNFSNVIIKNELESIRLKARRRNNEVALNFVDYYREQLKRRWY